MFYSGLMLSHHFPFNNMVVKLAVLLMALFTNVHRSLSTASTSSPTFGSLSQVPGLASLNRNEDQVDEQLYSRQLLVYGKSAQRKMQEAHILVIGSRQGLLISFCTHKTSHKYTFFIVVR
jgi:hypothetical protein